MSYLYLIAAILALFGAVGFWRGWLQEIGFLAGLLIGWMAIVALGPGLVDVANRIHLMVGFAFQGGFDQLNPGPLLQDLRQSPLVDPRRPDAFLGAVFLVLAVLAFLAASHFVAPASNFAARVLGLMVGLANGYLLTYLIFRYLAPSAQLSLGGSLDASAVADMLGTYLSTVLIVGVLLAIGIALLSSRRISRAPGVRAATGRGR